MKHKAALLASRGFAAIALKFFGEDDLPRDMFYADLDYVEEAAVFLKNHPKVDGRNGVGIIANCYGAAIAFGLATFAPKGLIRSMVAITGWFFPIGDFIYKKQKLPLPKKFEWGIHHTVDGITEWKYDFKRDDDADFRRAVESAFAFYYRYDTAYMFVAGSKDPYMPAYYFAAVVEHLLLTHQHPNYEILRYEDAGHLIESSFHPFSSVAWILKEPHNVGGEQPGHIIAQNDSWPKILDFTWRNLMRDKTTFKHRKHDTF